MARYSPEQHDLPDSAVRRDGIAVLPGHFDPVVPQRRAKSFAKPGPPWAAFLPHPGNR